jgi:hypothetical protein
METMEELMGNPLQMASQQHIRALLELKWSHRRIARELGIRRETVARYGTAGDSKPANLIAGSKGQNRPNLITGSGPQNAGPPGRHLPRRDVEQV